MNNKIITVYPECTNQRIPPLDYSSLPPFIKSQIKTEEVCKPVTYQIISNCYISPYGAVFKNGWLVMDSLYKMYPSKKNVFTFYKKIALGRVRKVNGPCLVAVNPFYNNYGHFLFESLPRIFATEDIHSSLNLIIPITAPKFVIEYIRLFNFKEIIFINENELVYAGEAILPNSYDFGTHHYELMQDLKQFLLKKVNGSFSNSKIILSRDKAAYRKSIHEEKLFHRLKELSFERVFAEDLSVTDQIRVFSGCNYLVGIHSTGLNNCFYMPSTGTVVDIILNGHHDISVYNVSQISKLKFSFYFTERLNNNPLVNFDDPKLDVDPIFNFVEKRTS